MHGDLDTRQAFQERPELPGCCKRKPGIEIHYLAQPVLCDRVSQRQHHGREAQLEIYGGLQLLLAAYLEDAGGFFQIATHGLLDQHCCPVGQGSQYIRMPGRWCGEIEDSAFNERRFLGTSKGFHIPLFRQLLSLLPVRIIEAGNWKATPCGRQGNERRRRSIPHRK